MTPSRKLEADFVDGCGFAQFVGNPCGGEFAVVLPFGEFVIVPTALHIAAISSCCGRGDGDGALLVGVGWGGRCLATVKHACEVLGGNVAAHAGIDALCISGGTPLNHGILHALGAGD